MKLKSKALIFSLIFIMLLSFFVACDDNQNSSTQTSAQITTTTSTPPSSTSTSIPPNTVTPPSTTSVPPIPSTPPPTPSVPPVEPDYDYDNAPKETVHILMWRKYYKSEQLLIDKYEKLTGAKIKTTITTEAEYPTKLVSMIDANKAPDIVMFQSRNFPGLVNKSLQPLQQQYFKLNYKCWNKTYMDAYKVNNIYFGVAMPSTWLCESNNYVTYYAPEILKSCGINEDPYELYKKGQWNWDTQNQMIRKIQSNGFVGYAAQHYDTFMLSAGVDFVKYNGKQYTNQLGKVTNSDLLTQAWMEVAKLHKENCITGLNISSSEQLKNIGIFTATAYGMYNEGQWISDSLGDYVAKNLKAVPVAGPKGKTSYTPVRPMLWGVPKKAKNPKGAAYFLSYFLDVNNYNQSSTFHTKQFEEVFKKITDTKTKKLVAFGSGICEYIYKGAYNEFCNTLVTTNPINMTKQLNYGENFNKVEQSVNRANKDIPRVK